MATISLGNLSKARPANSRATGTATLISARHLRSSLTSSLMMATDIAAVMLALYLSVHIGLARFLETRSLHSVLSSAEPLSWQAGYLACYLAALLLVSRHQGLYGHTLSYSVLYEQRKTVQSGLIAGLLLCGAIYTTHGGAVSRAVVLCLIIFSTLFTCIAHGAWRFIMVRRFEQGIDARNVVIVGASGLAIALQRQLSRDRHLGRAFKGFVHLAEMPSDTVSQGLPSLGTLDQIRSLARQHFIDEIIIAQPCSLDTVRDLIDVAREMSLEILVIPGFYDGITQEAPIEYVGDFPVVALHCRDEKVIGHFFKRASDIALAALALLLSMPLLLAIAIAVRLDSPGPVFYVSPRVGKKGRIFRCVKFRTMVVDAEKRKQALAAMNERTGILFKMRNDPRITRVGAYLRKYSLDEIPQFFNVLRGQMSLVGPRPPLASEVEQYEIEHFRRLEVLPGLTGLWQVRARQDPSFERYVALDLAYVENWSFWLDLKILIRTTEVIMRGTGS
ncbi:sugar transferase [Silvibacterium sp.]|uniref:sugar transferase n=1 Tax=Silvibacterium sp. TaxID=1964179 RepID=UPI0039E5410C